jgi:hypothetical protein
MVRGYEAAFYTDRVAVRERLIDVYDVLQDMFDEFA